ncbi:hypothetical protein C804_02001 [Lachnospiraceae bacterium A4]|nr:hypothetical protein C804_02001 [Lachnospiraceae bacterium A4]
MPNTRQNKNIPSEQENPLFHDTWKLLKNYRDAVWNLELAVQQVRSTFEIEYGSSIEEFLDSILTRIRHDGTLFDGEKIVSVTRGIRYYEHPVSMDICEDFVKLQSDIIYEEYKWNHSQLWFSDKTFQAEILNIHAESRPSRNLMQDLQDIKSGIEIRYDTDLRKADKEQKSRKRAKAMEKKIQALERKLLDVGYENLEPYSLEKVHADKWLTPDRIQELTEMREQRILEEKNRPVQLSLPLDVLYP